MYFKSTPDCSSLRLVRFFVLEASKETKHCTPCLHLGRVCVEMKSIGYYMSRAAQLISSPSSIINEVQIDEWRQRDVFPMRRDV